MSQFSTPIAGYRYVDLLVDDTLQRLALRETGDASRWSDIANLNGLLPPYVTGDATQASATIAPYGAQLLVPSATPMATASIDPALVFERDVLITDGRLTTTGGDFSLAVGVPNLKQSLRNVLATDKRDLLFHPSYGCDVRLQIGKGNSEVAAFLAAEYVRSALVSDSRVSSVPAAAVTMTGDQIYIDVEVVPIDQRLIQFGGYF